MRPYYNLSVQEVIQKQKTDSEQGLESQEVQVRLLTYGKNQIQKISRISPLRIFVTQFTDFLILILIAASILSYVIGEHLDAIVIGIIIVVNGILGFVQEYKAEKSIEALKKLEAPHALVVRDGKKMDILAEDLVPGDLIKLVEGSKIPADGRLIKTTALQIDESLLTGESLPVTKQTNPLFKNPTLAEQTNMVFSGSLVTTGKGEAIVTSTGMKTEIGKIAQMVQTEEKSKTPLQKKLDDWGKKLGLISITIVFPAFILGFLQNREPFNLFLTVVSLAVAAIPEGLPIVITIALALGVQRMIHSKALVRKLPIVEVLGGTNVVCTDKTGTLTCNAMTTQNIITAENFYMIKGEGFEPKGEVYATSFDLLNNSDLEKTQTQKAVLVTPQTALQSPALKKVLQGSVLCNDATLELGDPTERALIVAGAKLNFQQNLLRKEFKRIKEIPFSSDRKYMLTMHQKNTSNETLGFMKGAPEIILQHCSGIGLENSVKKLTEKIRRNILNANESMAKQGLRVLAIAYKENVSESETAESNLKNFIFAGLVGMIDPPRPEVPEAISTCRKAGIRVVMITGDHKLTAQAIGKKIGLDAENILTGEELDSLNDSELEKVVRKTSIFARVSSAHKLKILRALQADKQTVAMTGDGVNDAPAIKAADIGISVGSGTDLTKEVSDMILLNDNFATFEKAIAEGRTIYDNVKKFMKFLLASNFGEVLIILASILLFLPIPLFPIHILWINLLTDGLPALALTVDPSAPDIMKRKPRKAEENLFSGMLFFVFFGGVLAFLATMAAFLIKYPWWENPITDFDLSKPRTIAFTVLVFFELFIVFTCRHEKSAFALKIFSNKCLIMAIICSALLQIAVIYVPFLQVMFKTVALDWRDWIFVLSFSSLGFVGMEFFLRLRSLWQSKFSKTLK